MAFSRRVVAWHATSAARVLDAKARFQVFNVDHGGVSVVSNKSMSDQSHVTDARRSPLYSLADWCCGCASTIRRGTKMMEPSMLSPDAQRLVRTMQVFGQWVYTGDNAQRELLANKLARLDITCTRLALTELGRTLPRIVRTAL